MAADSLNEALIKANIKLEIQKAIMIDPMIGPMIEIQCRIDKASEVIIENLKNELRDYFAHEIMKHVRLLEKDGKPWETADYQLREFFDLVFKDIPAYKINL